MKNLTEVLGFVEEVLGKKSAQVFDENFEELVYYVRSSALSTPDLSEKEMKVTLFKLAEGIIAACVKRYVNDNYSDDYGDIKLNIGDGHIYDQNMNPVVALDRIKESQKEMTCLLVSRGMYEFAKGKHLAHVICERAKEDEEPNPKDQNWSQSPQILLEPLEVEIMRLESKLPNLTKEQATLLSSLYAKLRAARG